MTTSGNYLQQEHGLMVYPRRGWRKLMFKMPLYMWRLGLARLLPRNYLRLTMTGRKSGQPRHVMLEYSYINGRFYLLSGWGTKAQWVQNVLANPLVTVQTVREGTVAGQATVVTDDQEIATLYTQAKGASPFWGVYLASVGIEDTMQDFVAKKDRLCILRIDPVAASTQQMGDASGAPGVQRVPTVRPFFRYFWGVIAHPRMTFDALAKEPSVRWAVGLACLPVAQIWGNILLHQALGYDWLGTRPYIVDPTFIAGFGRLVIGLEHWVPIFAALMPLLALLGLLITPGLAQLMSKVWRGQGTFEQMVNTLTFAMTVPNLVIGATSEWLLSVPLNMIFQHDYFWEAAMRGELGPTIAIVWNIYVFGVYITLQYGWMIVLGGLAIRRVQKIPVWAAALTMVTAFSVHFFISSLFVR